VKTYATLQQQTFQLTIEETQQARFKEQGRETHTHPITSNNTVTSH